MSALGRVNTYCDPNDRTCGGGSDLWVAFGKKAEFGLRRIGELISGVSQPPGGPLPDRHWNGRPGGRPDSHRPRVPAEPDYPPRRRPGPGDE